MSTARKPLVEKMVIQKIHARTIFDSRGKETVEVDLFIKKGLMTGMCRAAVPNGCYNISALPKVETTKDASTDIQKLQDKPYGRIVRRLGKFDMDKHHRKAVSKAVENINQIIAPALVGKDLDITDQRKVDNILLKLDGTEDKSKLGLNAILAVSIAVCQAGSMQKGVLLCRHIADLAGNKDLVLPVPAFNVIDGGWRAENNLDMQELLLLPTGASSFTEAMTMGSSTYRHLKSKIMKSYGRDACNVGDEGGFAPKIKDTNEGLNLLKTAIEEAGYKGKIEIGMDVCASKFYVPNEAGTRHEYNIDFKKELADIINMDSLQLFLKYKVLLQDYPLVSIENAFSGQDLNGWVQMNRDYKGQLVGGDDLDLTNKKNLEEAIEKKACNCLSLKINQIGTVTESIDLCKMAQRAGWGVMVCQRGGETEDDFIADLAVGLCTGQIKAGAPCRGERLAKYNQILRIEEELAGAAKYAGKNFRHPLK